jgi:hypothetical protein
MTLSFNTLLTDVGIEPASVRLLRHMTELPDGRIPLELWHECTNAFDEYQSYQSSSQRARFARPWWANFAGTREGRTVFLGLYEIGAPAMIADDVVLPGTGQVMTAVTYDRYPVAPSDLLADYVGRLYIDWGGGSSGSRAWSQRAENQDKPITELRCEREDAPFPGLMRLAMPLSRIMRSPNSWRELLTNSRGVYLLTCPSSGALYVGSASGAHGFWGRWFTYDANGHGGNVGLVEREREDWIVSILQVAGSTETSDDVLASEALWKRKLESRTFGLNHN